MSQIEPPPNKVEKFNYIWKNWLNNLWIFIQEHTGGISPPPPVTGLNWNAHGNDCAGGGPYLIDGDTILQGRLAVGPSATINPGSSIFYLSENTEDSDAHIALRFQMDLRGDNLSATGINGFAGSSFVTTDATRILGGTFIAQWSPGAVYTVTEAVGLESSVICLASGTITDAVCLRIAGSIIFPPSTITNYKGIHSKGCANFLGALDDATSIWLDHQADGTINRGIVLDGDGAGSDVVFGTAQQAAIYYSSNLVLKGNRSGTGGVQAASKFITTNKRIKSVYRYIAVGAISGAAEVAFCNTDGGAYTITLPTGSLGHTLKVINSGTSNNILTVEPTGGQELLGTTTGFLLYDGETLELTYETNDGWY